MTTEGVEAPFCDFVQHFTEMYEVVRTVIVVRDRKLYKVDILRDQAQAGAFKVHFSRQERLAIQPVDSASKGEFKKVWVDLTLPWIETADANSALKQALLQLSEIKP